MECVSIRITCVIVWQSPISTIVDEFNSVCMFQRYNASIM